MHTLVGVLFLALVAFVLSEWNVTADLWWLPILYASIALHEMGHLIAGKLVGMEAGGVVVGGLMIFQIERALALSFGLPTLAFLARKEQGSGLTLHISAKMEGYRDECREALNGSSSEVAARP